jgi:hypothetical protein
MRVLRIWIGLLCSVPLPLLAGQQTPDRFPRWEAEVPSAEMPRGDYRYEGLVFGGAVFGAASAWVGANLGEACPLSVEPGVKCESDHLGNAVVLGLAGAAFGAGMGYLVGRLSPKRPARSLVPGTPSPSLVTVPDSVRRRVGYQHWRGAAIGSAVGAIVGTALGVGVGGCADCTVTSWDRVQAALAVTGIGGAAGLLAGLGTPRYVWERAER